MPITSITGEASRTYDPSTRTDFSFSVPSEYSLVVPASIPLKSGAAGTGWLALTYLSVKYCYQGNDPNNDSVGTGFVLKRTRTSGNCYDGDVFHAVGAGEIIVVPKADAPNPLIASVNGGGVSAGIRAMHTETIVEFAISVSKE